MEDNYSDDGSIKVCGLLLNNMLRCPASEDCQHIIRHRLGLLKEKETINMLEMFCFLVGLDELSVVKAVTNFNKSLLKGDTVYVSRKKTTISFIKEMIKHYGT